MPTQLSMSLVNTVDRSTIEPFIGWRCSGPSAQTAESDLHTQRWPLEQTKHWENLGKIWKKIIQSFPDEWNCNNAAHSFGNSAWWEADRRYSFWSLSRASSKFNILRHDCFSPFFSLFLDVWHLYSHWFFLAKVVVTSLTVRNFSLPRWLSF